MTVQDLDGANLALQKKLLKKLLATYINFCKLQVKSRHIYLLELQLEVFSFRLFNIHTQMKL